MENQEPKKPETNTEETEINVEELSEEKISAVTDPKEAEKIREAIEEKVFEPQEDTSKDDNEPAKADTSEESSEHTENTPDKTETQEYLTDELIEKVPEEQRTILEKYKGKDKKEVAKAVANAIAMKNDLMKGDEVIINRLTEKYADYDDEKLLDELVKTQKKVGEPKIETPPKPKPIEEVPLPETEEVSQMIQKEVMKKLKAKYDTLPDDLNGADYLEWERDLQDERGFLGVQKFIEEKNKIEKEVKQGMQKIIYAQEYLPNLYVENPNEIIDYITPETLPQLKNINDNYTKINDVVVQKNVDKIIQELNTLGLKPDDLGVDLSLAEKDGSLYNEELYSLLFNGDDIDYRVVQKIGKVHLLKENELAQKFLDKYRGKILSEAMKVQMTQEKGQKEILRQTNIQNLHQGSQTEQQNTIDVTKITDPNELRKIMREIEESVD